MIKKAMTGFLAVATVAGSLIATAPQAEARGGRVAGAIIGGLAVGALVGAAIANSQGGYYGGSGYYDPGYGYAPVYGGGYYYGGGPTYVVQPSCRIQRQRVWDEWNGYWRVQRVRVCY